MAGLSGEPDVTAQEAAPGHLRARVLRGLALHFAFVMAMVSVLIATAGGAADGVPLVLRLAILAVVLPIAMVKLAGAILEPASSLDAETRELRSLSSQARLDALLDPITGLGNHRAFQEELHRQIEDAARHRHSLALVVADLDGLKKVNDELGHAGGDTLLASVGRLITASSRAADRGFRIGGDEFAILLPHADAAEAHAITRRILAAAVAAESTFGRPFSFSAGVTAYPKPSGDGSAMLQNADAALYLAKRHGRTDIQLFDPERHADSDEYRGSAELAEAIDRITSERLVTPVFQPIFDLHSGAVVGFEGLVRPTADAGFRDASALFAAAEISDRTVELDMVAVETIVAGIEGDLGDGYLSVNLSPRSLETEVFQVASLARILETHGLTADRVVLELTEREAVEDMNRLRTNIQACQAAGFRVAADDVGAGNAGLRLLSEIGFDIVKIDLSLVQGGVLRDSAVSVLRAIQELGTRAGATVVAEGIETVEQLEVVRQLDIATGQGYLFAAPGSEVAAEPIDLGQLVSSHEARRRALLGDPVPGSAWASRSQPKDPEPVAAVLPREPEPATAAPAREAEPGVRAASASSPKPRATRSKRRRKSAAARSARFA
jgi:diguanylate cyclase (GGDEF)-like protein